MPAASTGSWLASSATLRALLLSLFSSLRMRIACCGSGGIASIVFSTSVSSCSTVPGGRAGRVTALIGATTSGLAGAAGPPSAPPAKANRPRALRRKNWLRRLRKMPNMVGPRVLPWVAVATTAVAAGRGRSHSLTFIRLTAGPTLILWVAPIRGRIFGSSPPSFCR